MQVETKLPAYQGFIITPEVEKITLINPFKLNAGSNAGVKLFRHDTNRWTNVGGKPDRYREITQATNMNHPDYTYEVKLYSVWKPEAGQEMERFAFYTDTSKSPKGCFMRIGDLKARLQDTVANIEKVYRADWDKEDQNMICIPVWPINGGRAGREQFSWIKRAGRNFIKQYTIHCNIAQRASVSIVEGWSPHLRYWDKGSKDLKIHFLILVNRTIFDRVDVKRHVEDIINNYNIRFKPEKCDIQCEGTVDGKVLDRYTFLSEHILGFYKTYVLTTHLPGLKNGGAVLEDRKPFASDSGKVKNLHEDKFKDSNVSAASQTSTKVTRTKILGARQIFRTPQQVAVMKNLATSTIASAFWGTGSDAKKFYGETEWLHRSAFGFGGLGEDGVQPGSSQVMGNLVFGTYDANTFMLRFEASVKNLTIHEDKYTGNITHSRVSTRLQFPPQVWGDRPKYFWCAPQLEYHWYFWCTPLKSELNGLQHVNLLARRPPTRFEAYLDELIEDDIYDQIAPVAIESAPELVDALQADAVTYVATVSGPEDEAA